MVHVSNLFTERLTPEFPVELELEFQWSGEGARYKPGPAQGACHAPGAPRCSWGAAGSAVPFPALESPAQTWRSPGGPRAGESQARPALDPVVSL